MGTSVQLRRPLCSQPLLGTENKAPHKAHSSPSHPCPSRRLGNMVPGTFQHQRALSGGALPPASTVGSLLELPWAGADSPDAHSVLPDRPLCWGSPAGSPAREGNG